MSGRVLNRHTDVLTNGVWITRWSPYGNPFIIGVDGDRQTCIDRFEKEILPDLDVSRLLGKDLICCCAPKPCHGDPIIRKLYNGL